MAHDRLSVTPDGRRAAVLSVVIGIGLLTSACASSTPSASSPTHSPSAVVSPSLAPSPSPEPSTSPQATRMTVAGSVEAGPAVRFTVQLPADWEPFPGMYGALLEPPDPDPGIVFFVSLIDNVFADPCTHVQRSPKVSTIDAAAKALGEIPNTTATVPAQATIAGQAATYIELMIPAKLPCPRLQFYLWQDSPEGFWWPAKDAITELLRVWIFEVAGERVAVAARSWPGTTREAKAELQEVLDSIVFDVAT